MVRRVELEGNNVAGVRLDRVWFELVDHFPDRDRMDCYLSFSHYRRRGRRRLRGVGGLCTRRNDPRTASYPGCKRQTGVPHCFVPYNTTSMKHRFDAAQC